MRTNSENKDKTKPPKYDLSATYLTLVKTQGTDLGAYFNILLKQKRV